MATELRDYQEKAVAQLAHALKCGMKRPMLQAPTGAGKTEIAANITQRALAKSKRVGFCVPVLSLIDQTVKRFWDEGIDEIGVMQGDHPLHRPHAPVQVISIPTLVKRELPNLDLVFVDEAHLQFARVFEWMGQRPDLPFIGLSATPWTKGLGDRYQGLIVVETIQGLIDRGYLSKFKVYAPVAFDLTGVRTTRGDWNEQDISDRIKKGDTRLVGDVVKTWKQVGENRPTIAFCVDRAHADKLCSDFNDEGIPAEYVDCFTERDERDNIRLRFHAGLTKIVCNVDTLGVGIDWDIRCVILARPHKSDMAYVQKIGRGLRMLPGKTDCIIIDHSDTTRRLGFVTDIHYDRLDTEKARARREAPPDVLKTCPKCACIRPRGVLICPACGFEVTPASLSEGLFQPGELEVCDSVVVKDAWDIQQAFFSELLWIAHERGYNPKWADNQFRVKYKQWPPDRFHRARKRPSDTTLRWVRSRQIAWAKSKRKRSQR